MNVEYLRTSRKSYMMIKNADYAFENYELQMILHNDIPSLLEFQVIVGDGSAEYWYNVTGMQSLEKQLSIVPVREKQLRFLLQNIIELKREMEEYLLDDENICFSPSMIYYDRFADRIRFCYIPGFVQQETNRGIRELFEEILQHLDHSDIIAVRMGYDMYERSMQSEFIVEDCIECLTNHMTGEEERQKQAADSGTEYPDPEWEEDFVKKEELSADRQYRMKAAPDTGAEQELEFLRPDQEKRRGHRRKRRRGKKERMVDYSEILDEEQRNFYAAEEIQGKDYTECFSDEDTENRWELIYKGDGLEQDLQPESFPYLVGTDRNKVQGILQSRTISRVHARLYTENDMLYVEDYNSTNGTYLNRRLLPMNTPTELKPGDRIVFATEEFEVHCRRVPRIH